ncbi:MAG: 5-oxoprolinase [Gemmatimonadales bacterium]|nr:MAG: 5-oxoprolinase [Gemmatimonadales bacterium]
MTTVPRTGHWEIRVDTGGTFTDCLARDPAGGLHRAKVLSTSALRGVIRSVEDGGHDLQVTEGWGAPRELPLGFDFHLQGDAEVAGVVRGWDPGAGRLSLDPRAGGPVRAPAGTGFELRSPEPAPLLVARLVTGTPAGTAFPDLSLRMATTRGTNALLERRGAPLAMLVTEGFGDVLRIGDQRRPDLFALDIRRPHPLVEPSGPGAESTPGGGSRVVEVRERILADGSVHVPLTRETLEGLRGSVRRLLEAGVESFAVVLLHAWRNGAHEEMLAEFLREAGVPHVVRSSEVAPFMNLLQRARTTTVEGYLGPVVRDYVREIGSALPAGRLLVMTSSGGLVGGAELRASETLLSGPAGGVIGAAIVGRRAGFPRVIAFDMGGTSTDVSRHGGTPEYREEHQVGDALLRAPALAIETVAAGGGSVCALGPDGLVVGPESAGAAPGPACYGSGGPLTLTDVNLLLGRVDPNRFGIPVQVAPARFRAEEVRASLGRREGGEAPPLELLLEGFIELADERMADAIRRISVRKGYDPADHALVAFGGAGPQHACAVAARLGMPRVLVPADAGILSAVGLGHAALERFGRREVLAGLDDVADRLPGWFDALEGEARSALEAEGPGGGVASGVPRRSPNAVHDGAHEGVHHGVHIRERVLHLRYLGQEATLEVPFHPENPGAAGLRAAFEDAHEGVYGHRAPGRGVEVASMRVVAAVEGPPVAAVAEVPPFPALPGGTRRCWIGGRWQVLPTFDRASLAPGAAFAGPALVLDRFSGTVVLPGWSARLDGGGTLVLEASASHVGAGGEGPGAVAGASPLPVRARVVEEELFVQRFLALVEEMGEQLRRTAISVNIRERLDFSCALLDPAGRLVANAPHIPVHLGAMGLCVRRVAEALALAPGDVAVTNHPGHGGSHLPDVTVVTPVFAPAPDGIPADPPRLLGYVASRAHHAEIGGARPGSMPPDARSLAEEGVVVEPRYLVRRGRADWEGMRQLLSHPPEGQFPSRAVEENLVDLAAQVAANHRGAGLLQGLAQAAGAGAGARAGGEGGADALLSHMDALRNRAERRMRTVLGELPDGSFLGEERLDDGTPLRVEIRVSGDEAVVDFTGSGGVHPGNLNATEAIVRSAVLYVLRLLAGEDLPLNEGLMAPVRLVLPEGLLNPPFGPDPRNCPAVVGGNTETSQRLVDTLLKPFGRVAGSQGTMNNLLFGDESLSYYETIGGGAGAGPGFAGAHAVQVHMTNTGITDVEVLEHRFPVRVERFAVRAGSGGAGRWPGGDGVVRELTFLRPLSLSVLTQHRVESPHGSGGGRPGARGRQRLVRASGAVEELRSIDGREVEAGDRLVMETPGGGGFGDAGEGEA